MIKFVKQIIIEFFFVYFIPNILNHILFEGLFSLFIKMLEIKIEGLFDLKMSHNRLLHLLLFAFFIVLFIVCHHIMEFFTKDL